MASEGVKKNKNEGNVCKLRDQKTNKQKNVEGQENNSF